MNVFIEEIKLNKKEYSFSLLWFLTLTTIAWLFLDSIVTEFFENIYRFMVIIFFSGSFGRVPAMKAEKFMQLHSKLPLKISHLFIIRLTKTYLLATILPIILSIVYVWESQALSSEVILFMIMFIFFTFGYWAYEDAKIISISKGILKRFLLTFIAIVILLLPLAGFIYALKTTVNDLTENIFVNMPFLIFYVLYSTSFSYYLFKKRKNYKV